MFPPHKSKTVVSKLCCSNWPLISMISKGYWHPQVSHADNVMCWYRFKNYFDTDFFDYFKKKWQVWRVPPEFSKSDYWNSCRWVSSSSGQEAGFAAGTIDWHPWNCFVNPPTLKWFVSSLTWNKYIVETFVNPVQATFLATRGSMDGHVGLKVAPWLWSRRLDGLPWKFA